MNSENQGVNLEATIALAALHPATNVILPGTCGAFWAELAALCFERNRHPSGVIVPLRGWRAGKVQATWPQVEASVRELWADDVEAAQQFGAYAVATLTLIELTEWKVERVFPKRSADGFDILLRSLDPGGAVLKSRLEVSGIMKGARPLVKARVRAKLEQTRRGDETGWWPAWVCVVEFGEPGIVLVQREASDDQ